MPKTRLVIVAARLLVRMKLGRKELLGDVGEARGKGWGVGKGEPVGEILVALLFGKGDVGSGIWFGRLEDELGRDMMVVTKKVGSDESGIECWAAPVF